MGRPGRGAAAAYRRVHERWLTWALASDAPIPRIPVKRVSDGGFSRLTARPRGRELAERWWRTAFTVLDRLD